MVWPCIILTQNLDYTLDCRSENALAIFVCRFQIFTLFCFLCLQYNTALDRVPVKDVDPATVYSKARCCESQTESRELEVCCGGHTERVRRDEERLRGELLGLQNEEGRREAGGMSGDAEGTKWRLLYIRRCFRSWELFLCSRGRCFQACLHSPLDFCRVLGTQHLSPGWLPSLC